MRSSTVNLPAIVGFASAVEILRKEGQSENKRFLKLRDFFIDEILKKIDKTQLNGPRQQRLANNINISFFGVEGESLMLELDHYGIAVATGSACSSKTLEPSHVLLAIGLSPAKAHGSLRISLGRWTKKDDLLYVVDVLKKVVKRLRKISPIYDQ